jgi:hypothetical protein
MPSFLEFLQSLVGLLNLPGIISDNILSFFEKLGVDIPVGTSGSNLTFESEAGFPPHWSRASLAHANRNFHHSQAQ